MREQNTFNGFNRLKLPIRMNSFGEGISPNSITKITVLILDFFRHADRPQLFGVRFFCKKKIMERRRS